MPWQIQNTSPNHCLLRLHKLHYYTASYAHSAKMWHSARDATSSVCNHVLGEGLDAPGEGAIWGAPLQYGLSSKFFDHLSHVSTAKWLYAHHDADITSELATREYGQNICWPCAPNKKMHHCSCRIDTRPMLYVARIITLSIIPCIQHILAISKMFTKQEQVITPLSARQYTLQWWQFDLSRIYDRPQTGPQSTCG